MICKYDYGKMATDEWDGMRLIEDIGMIYPKDNSTKKVHMGVFQCTKCKEIAVRSMYNVVSRKQKYCRPCTSSIVKNAITHGYSKDRLYNIYMGMHKRCYGNEDIHYRYKELGITICDVWLDNYNIFKEWAVNNGYSDELSIDRIDNTKEYSPDNCRWTTREVQARNTRKIKSSNTSGYRGVSWHKRDKVYTSSISIGSKKVHIGYFDTALLAAIAYDTYVLNNNLEHTINGGICGVHTNPLNTKNVTDLHDTQS